MVLSDPRTRAIVFQVLLVGGLGLFLWVIIDNTLTNLNNQNIATGFGFLSEEAGFELSESMIDYELGDTYLKAFVVGLLNTLKVSAIGIVLATILGVLVGVARLSHNWLLRQLAGVYVETLRNIPLLLQLFVWYGVITVSMPLVRESYSLGGGIFLNNRGLYFPWPEAHFGWVTAGSGLLVGIAVAVALAFWAKARQDRTGKAFPVLWVSMATIFGLFIAGWLIGGAPLVFDTPEQTRFNLRGGARLTPEFKALLIGLVTYTAAFIAENVRSGILAVSTGQTEAAHALGLSRGQTLRKVILPQALRVIVPPTTSQYLNLTKNSSLAVAIGYLDLVSVGGTILNQTGQALEAIAIYMAVYLFISLVISLFMNWYNKRISLKER